MKAFTLAEVLITLVIIGVIAAITIPTITANHRKEETLARLKKFYSTMNQVVLKAQADGNNWDYWAEEADHSQDSTPETAKKFAEQYILPYMIYYKYEIKGGHVYVYLNDGSYFYIQKGLCIDIKFDLNGERKPNRMGRDRFIFLYCPINQNYFRTGKVIPYKEKQKTRDDLLNECKTEGYWCSGLLAIDGWQFKDDYPYHI